MKMIVFATALLGAICFSATAQAQTQSYKLTLNVSNLLERKGTIRVGLVTKADNFMGKADIDTMVAVPAEGPLVITFAKLPAGTYAVRLHQDINDNKQMDMENGRPAEPFGFSKITMLMGPPSFEDASFQLDKDTDMKIALISL